MFQTAVGKNIANPTAMLMCASKMLRHVNLKHYSESIRTAIREVLAAGKVSIINLLLVIKYLIIIFIFIVLV